MPVAVLDHELDFEGWRRQARQLRLTGARPEAISWRVCGDLFAATEQADITGSETPQFSTPAAFVDLARNLVCHRDPERFSLMYRLLWRLGGDGDLLHRLTDPDVAAANLMAKAVSRASHKMKAFVRFRQCADERGETYVAWFEPPHRVLERTSGFFVKRFANMRFSILTPDSCLHWDGEAAAFTPGVDRSCAPTGDVVEDYWKTYYASIFNPARLKVKAMQTEMPKRYWRNLPEASLIPGLIAEANQRSSAMMQAAPVQPNRRIHHAPVAPQPEAADVLPASLAEIAQAIQVCRRCDLWRHTTQGVAGQGPQTARLMLVGEQPGDQEDLAGLPFVGPAGEVLNRAMAEADLPRAEVFVTNAVKHFKHEPRGKRRLHKTPETPEINACRFWQDQERRLIKPRLVLAMGATAVQSVLGKVVPIAKAKGQMFQAPDQSQVMLTWHPSYILRIPDAAGKEAAYGRLVEDLAAAWAFVQA
jgi:probable DNA metabolism protein